jgi:hypothetical protein
VLVETVDRDIVFKRGGDMELTLDVYHPPEVVVPKRMAIIHLFGGGFFVGNKKPATSLSMQWH